MRHLLLYLLIFIVHIHQSYASPTSSLNTPVNIKIEQASINEVFRQISIQTGLIFSYNPQEINITKKVSVKADNKPVSSVLKDILEPYVAIKGQGRYIILTIDAANNNTADDNKFSNIEKNEEPVVIAEREIIPFVENISLPDSGDPNLVCHSSINFKNTNMISKKQITTFLAALALTTATVQEVSAQQQEETVPKEQINYEEMDDVPEAEGKRPFQMSFVYPLSTNGMASKNYAYNFSVNIIGGVTGGLNGCEWGGIFNINRNRTMGAQFAGIFNKTEYMKGAQFAGIFNMTNNSDKASQFAGIFNYGGKGKTIVQFGGIGNVAGSSMVQAGGIGNISGSSKVQVAGIANVSDNAGIQVGGVANVARKSKVQIGIVNISDTANVQIGLVNLSKNGFIEVELAGGEFLHTTASFRSGTKYLYGIVSLGYNFSDNFWGYGAGLGTSIEFNKFGLNFEAVHLSLADKDFWQDAHNQLTQVRALMYVNIGSKLKIFGGPVLNYYFADTDAKNKLNISAPYSIWDKNTTNRKHEGWIGASIGARVRF